MSGIEVLAGLGLVATELFRYNRENYEFDQDQRFEREEMRLKMQVERFALFREDVRDLVDLTVSKMDLYHMVGALFLKACLVYYCEGFFLKAPPVYLLTLYYLTNACSIVYFVLGVWLAMHASISSHSHGTKLLTRFVRLPIPGSEQLNQLNARFADFERQGVQMMRVPFLHRKEGNYKHQTWLQKAELAGQAQANGVASGEPKANRADLLGSGEKALTYDDEAELMQAVEMRTQRHVQLFRKLQAKWQCYDAYARVCMSLGARQLIQSICYFLIGYTLVENTHHSVAYALVAAMQAVGIAVSVLDIHSWPCWGNLDLVVLGAGPGILAILALTWVERNSDGTLREDNRYLLSLFAYPLEIIGFELLLWAAAPSGGDASLPRHFRTVLFMDVYGEVDDPTEADFKTGARILSEEQRASAETQLPEAAASLAMAQAALRRWEAVPQDMLSSVQRRQRALVRKALKLNIKSLTDHLERFQLPSLTPQEEALTRWEDLSVHDRAMDPFINSLIGPFDETRGDGQVQQVYYDLDRNLYIYEMNNAGRRILTLMDVLQLVHNFELEVQRFCEAAGDKGTRAEVGADAGEEEGNDETVPLRRQSEDSMPSRATVHLNRARRNADGSKAVDVKPVRLPWKLVKGLTRCVQLSWLAICVLAIMRETNFRNFSSQESNIVERRLAAMNVAAVRWHFEHAEVAWPLGAFFRPEALSCLPPTAAADAKAFLVGSPFAVYQALHGPSGVVLEELPRPSFPPGTLAFCGQRPGAAATGGPLGTTAPAPAAAPCLLGVPAQDGVLLWPMGADQNSTEATLLKVQQAPWQLLAGATVPCEDAGLLDIAGGGPGGAEGPVSVVPAEPWCLLLAGWAGGEEISVVVVPLQGGPGSRPQAPSRPLEPHFELPLDLPADGLAVAAEVPRTAPPRVAALHLEPRRGRLWVLMANGDLQIWTLLHGPPQHLGRLPRQWPAHAGAFRAKAVCEDHASRRLFVAGRTSFRQRWGRKIAAAGPVLLQAELPAGF